jgi:prepilin-type N-terminal cleavage/methylation domain-containing protein
VHLRRVQRPIIRRARRGFTLLEVAVAIIVLAVGIVAVQSLVAATTNVTMVNNELQTATMLGNAMQERCLGLDRPELLTLNGKSYSPPLDSQAQALTELPDYTQRVVVTYVAPRSIGVDSTTATDLLRVSVTVSHNGRDVQTSSRLIATTKQD